MKSNQERSNECLPPKKREIPSSTLPSENRSPVVPPSSDSQRTENMTWLASVAGGNESNMTDRRSSNQSNGPVHKSSSLSHSPPCSSSLRVVSSLPTVYTSPITQATVGGTVHYTQLPPNLQLIASPYATSYTGYISPQLLPPPPPPPPLSSSAPPRVQYTDTTSVPAHVAKVDQQRTSSERLCMPPPSTDSIPHGIHVSTSPRTLASTQHQGGTHLLAQSIQSHHNPGQVLSHVPVKHTDGPIRKDEGSPRHRELHNGELERGRRPRLSLESGLSGSKSREQMSCLSFHEARQLVRSSDYTSHDHLALKTSVMLMPNSHEDHALVQCRASPEKLTVSSPHRLDKGGIIMGKPVHRAGLSSNTTCSFAVLPPPNVEHLKAAVSSFPPHTVIQTTHNATESLSMGLPSTGIYPQPPIIGYIAGGNGSGYHTSFQQHLLIPSIIPVTAGEVSTIEPASVQATSSAAVAPLHNALQNTYVAATLPKGESLGNQSGSFHKAAPGAVVQAQIHLPMSIMPPAAPQSPSVEPPSSLPPYFIKGSIIQLADGELKHVEDLKTEDFIQSADISSELKIDSSTVERIEGSQTSDNFAVVQFSVGEHHTQVSVEVLLEYPFFVFGQGWSSCCPNRTTQLLELPCSKLSVGDVCISLTLKNLRNGSLKKTPPPEPAVHASMLPLGYGHLRLHRAVSDVAQSCGGANPWQRENGISQRGSGESGIGSGRGSSVENGDIFEERRSVFKVQGANSPCGKAASSRKRRWSAPEGRKVEKAEEEPPASLPKPSFIPHEVKVSIEGRSNIGK